MPKDWFSDLLIGCTATIILMAVTALLIFLIGSLV